MYMGMCTQYLNNLLHHQHVYHTLLEINFLQWLNQWPIMINNLFSNLLLHQFQPLYRLLSVYQLMYLEVLFTKHQMEDNLEIHLEEIHPKEIYLESHLLIHLLDLMDGQHLTDACLYHHGINHLLCNLYQSQQPSCPIGKYNIQPMSKIIIVMFILERSKRPLRLMVK